MTNSPYYLEALGAHAAERPLIDLPSLSKATLMTEFERVVTDPRLRLADLQAHLASPDPSQSFLGAYRVATTSGTTGRRSIVAFTSDEAAAWRAVSARPMMRIGVGPGPRRSVAPGQRGAEVLLTNLINYAQPLIRYELTDSVGESPLPNPAGRPWRCLLSIDGRTADILYLCGPDGATVPVHPSVLGSAVAPIAEVGEYDFVYDANGLHAQIVLIPGVSTDVAGRLREALAVAIGATGAITPAVDVQPVPTLEREPGGKIRLVRSA
ncbi:MAG TPA: hypothetical protein VI094_21435 [Propionibacteriaceae bacterium]